MADDGTTEDATVNDAGVGGDALASLEDVPTDTTCIVRLRSDDGDCEEAILHRTGSSVAGWLNACQHMTHVPIDKGDGATMRDDEFVCQNHGAYFDADTGYCSHGPCEGASLEPVDVTVVDGTVYLVDDAYRYVGDGPIERDPTDLASRSNLEF